MPRSKSRLKSHPEIEKTISELQAWCAEERGRQMEIARFLDVSRQLVTDWLSRKANPMAYMLFKIRDFLGEQRKGRKSK
jgi:transcriptional regulator with XRE-family HTH domain